MHAHDASVRILLCTIDLPLLFSPFFARHCFLSSSSPSKRSTYSHSKPAHTNRSL